MDRTTAECPGCTWGTVPNPPATPYYAQFDIATDYGEYFQINTIGN